MIPLEKNPTSMGFGRYNLPKMESSQTCSCFLDIVEVPGPPRGKGVKPDASGAAPTGPDAAQNHWYL